MIDTELEPNRTDTRRATNTNTRPAIDTDTSRNVQAVGLIAFIVTALLVVAGFIYYGNQPTVTTPAGVSNGVTTTEPGIAPNTSRTTTTPTNNTAAQQQAPAQK
ncbi:MAG TPA: hypothetical protein VHA13_00355 [Gammaproteobacteria bacterium]|nr:hypothetical protein [Gammaproteobacteria bacterium]